MKKADTQKGIRRELFLSNIGRRPPFDRSPIGLLAMT
jgi:hypothetical protein